MKTDITFRNRALRLLMAFILCLLLIAPVLAALSHMNTTTTARQRESPIPMKNHFGDVVAKKALSGKHGTENTK